MTRTELLAILKRAVADGAITQRDADELLRAFDAGELSERDLAKALDDDSDGASVLFALLLLSRLRARPKGWTWSAKERRYTSPPAPTRGAPQAPTAPPSPARGAPPTPPPGRAPGPPPTAPPPPRPRTVIDPPTVRAVVDHVIDTAEPEMMRPAERLAAKKISLAEFAAGFEEQLIARHIAAAAAAAGGFDQLSTADREFTRSKIEAQLEFADGMYKDIASGKQPMDGRLQARVQLYSQASRGTFEAVRGRMAERAGLTEELNVLAPADHCRLCLSETRRGWVRIGTLIPVGQRTCRSRDRCHIRYRIGNTEAA